MRPLRGGRRPTDEAELAISCLSIALGLLAIAALVLWAMQEVGGG